MSIACAGYNNQGEFLFISKNSDRNDFHLNTVNSAQNGTPYYSQPLSNIAGYPTNTNEVFGGLCSFSKSSSSFYLNFDSNIIIPLSNKSNATTGNTTSTSLYNTTLSTIYQINYVDHEGSKNQFRKTSIQLQNTTLSSFVEVAVSNVPSLAYVAAKATSANNQPQFSLNFMSLNEPTQHNISRDISGNGILAVGGNQSQHLYLFENNAITKYRLDSRDYAQASLQTNFDMKRIKSGTTGQVYSANTSTSISDYYISIFNSDNAELHIFHHNSSKSSYSPLLWENNYISFGNKIDNSRVNETSKSNSTLTRTSNNNSSSPQTTHNIRTQIIDKATISIKSTATKSKNEPSSEATTLISGKLEIGVRVKNTPHPEKRGLQQTGNSITSTDGSFNYQKSGVTSEDGSLVSAVALSDAPSSPEDLPPYNILLLSGNDADGYHTSTMTGSGLSVSIADDSGISGGAIAGIVIGVLVSLGIVFGLLIYARKRKNREQRMRSFKSASLPIQPEDFVTPYIASHDLEKDENHSNTSSILQEAKCIPEEYHDDHRPDIRPLCYTKDKIEYASPSQSELLLLEPDVLGELFLFSGQYISSAEERVIYLREGYAIRTFVATNGGKHTVHYFSSANLDTFVRSVHSVKQSTTSKKPETNKYIMRSDMAIVLSEPTPHFAYQYIWITSPMIPEQSLYHLIYERRMQTSIDHHNMDYKIWSIYTVLKCVETIHSHNVVHLAIDLKAFYYDHESKPTDWRLGNFGHAKTLLKNSSGSLPPNNAFTAPEIINLKAGAEQESADIWSTGCVIYTVATGGLSLFENDSQVKYLATFKDDLEQHIRIAIRDNVENPTFKYILDLMLNVDPLERKSIIQALEFWNSVYNMEG